MPTIWLRMMPLIGRVIAYKKPWALSAAHENQTLIALSPSQGCCAQPSISPSSCNLLAKRTMARGLCWIFPPFPPSPLPSSLPAPALQLSLHPIGPTHLHGQPQFGLHPETRQSLPPWPTFPGSPSSACTPAAPTPALARSCGTHNRPRLLTPPAPRSPSFNKSRFLFPQQIKDQEGVKNSFSSQWRGRGAGKAGALGTL